jgi:hypothetical protein
LFVWISTIDHYILSVIACIVIIQFRDIYVVLLPSMMALKPVCNIYSVSWGGIWLIWCQACFNRLLVTKLGVSLWLWLNIVELIQVK